ncbi:hypothetical protein N7495_004791 [Penicillium taxi]|uniref:uncharacterized protein n=1 Tax=Penicillium taxi TaxID=168475 RepID=UPI00254590C7|nr:uncharacterized protein N7495_004791 [Penicillium taxi]KAJ5900047.1 hypothetical protein N7495_004791 [Penicillium taxi]
MSGNQSSPDTILLETLVPGYAFISRFLNSYLNIDLSAYVQTIVMLAVIGAAIRYSMTYVFDFISEYFISKAEIRLDDEIFSYLMYWFSRQPRMNTTRFVAGVKMNSYNNESDDEDNQDEDESDEPGKGTSKSFDDYWAKVVSRDKYKPLRFTPSQGSHFFWYKGHLLRVERVEQNNNARSWLLTNERLYLSCLGRDATILRTLLAEAQQAYVERDGNRTVIYRGQRYGGSIDWARCMARAPRPLSTVVLDSAQKNAFIDDIKEYLHPRTRRWYSNRGIPYRRGYLLHGPPGTGKTSLCFAAAGLLGLKLYLLNLNSKQLDEDALSSLFSELPRRCIILLEDIDTAGITHQRGKPVEKEKKDSEESSENGEDVDAVVVQDTDSPATVIEEDKQTGITLSGLLNVIDGVAASEGRILVMTTNHPEKLDPALLRPGRVDMSVVFGYTSRAATEELFRSMYMTMDDDFPRKSKKPAQVKSAEKEKKEQEMKAERKERFEARQSQVASLATTFGNAVPSGEFTAAEIQGYLLNHKESPEKAIEGVPAWVKGLREKKKALEEKP